MPSRSDGATGLGRDALNTFLSKLDRVKPNGNGWQALCPAHEDRSPSLTISEGEKGVLLHCHAGCAPEAVVEALGLKLADLFYEAPERASERTPEVSYDYLDERGELLYQVVRKPGKQFRQRRPLGDGWAWSLNGTRRVLYRLPLVLAAIKAGAPVWVAEGEKDVDALEAAGFAATCNPGGVGKWRPEYANVLAGVDVTIVADKDEPGRKHARQVADSLAGVAASVRIVEAKEGKDASDHLAAGHSRDDFVPFADEPVPVCALDETVAVFARWLHLPDLGPVYATLGAAAANYLPGNPVWLVLVGPPASGKTELLASLSRLPDVYPAATLTEPSLLSGSPKKEHASDAKGGLLRAIGDFGLIVLKDMGSILSMRPDAKTETLAALREVYDGSWTRHVGTDGGRTLHWSGKVGLLAGVTPVIDRHHGVLSTMGERFTLCRLAEASDAQALIALSHVGGQENTMREELATAVAGLFAGRRSEPRALDDEEQHELVRLAGLVARARSAVERDRYTRDIEQVLGAEGPARLAITLERLLAGLDTLGCDRELAWQTIRRVALDCIPVLRRQLLEHLCDQAEPQTTKDIAEVIDLPTSVVRRGLEDLTAYHLARRAGKDGKSDLWAVSEWARERLR